MEEMEEGMSEEASKLGEAVWRRGWRWRKTSLLHNSKGSLARLFCIPIPQSLLSSSYVGIRKVS